MGDDNIGDLVLLSRLRVRSLTPPNAQMKNRILMSAFALVLTSFVFSQGAFGQPIVLLQPQILPSSGGIVPRPSCPVATGPYEEGGSVELSVPWSPIPPTGTPVAILVGPNGGGDPATGLMGVGCSNFSYWVDICIDGTNEQCVNTNRKGNGPPSCGCGDPINIGTGNLFEQVTDYQTSGLNQLVFARASNSLVPSGPHGPPTFTTFAVTLGPGWRSTYDRYLDITSLSGISIERWNGQVLNFYFDGTVWTGDTDVDLTLTQAGSTWTLTDNGDTVETYTTVSDTSATGAPGEALLTSIQARNGYTQTLNYNSSNQLLSVTDSYNRTLTFTYENGLLQNVTTPDGLVLTYSYNSSGVLASASYSTTPATSQSYVYENANLPFALTGIIDEDGNRYATWSYDQLGRGLTSQHAGGADLTTVTYDDNYATRTVTNALGETNTYAFTTLQGAQKVTSITRAATGTVASATESFTYDSNGYLASQTDWSGNLTTYVNNPQGEPLTVNQAVGTPQATTTTTTYLSNYHLPSQIVTAGLTTNFTYDSSGDLLTQTSVDTTTNTSPYSTSGNTRTWTYTWQNFLQASAQAPNGNLTSYGYDATGALISTTNALNQVTNITQHTGGGYPQVIVNPNNVTTTLTYTPRMWLASSAVTTSKGVLTTSYGYDAAGNLTSVTQPDNSKLTYSYDAAHRLTGVTDLLGNQMAYTLDALGDVTLTNVSNPAASLRRQHSDVFDALGRTLQDIGGVGQTTTYTYDNNGNALTITDPNGNLTQQSFDALNRLSTVIAPAPGGTTKTTYDQHNRVLSVTDPNSNTTAYIYDGFGDLIQQTSPDSGNTVFRYDADANLTRTTNAAGAIATNSYDALDRVLHTVYPNDATENVSYFYDQAGHGFGIGYLTSLKDAAGTLSRSYDAQGNLLSENRVNGSVSLKTTYTYDLASRIASIAYPSATSIAYTRNAMGNITRVSAKIPGATSYIPVTSGISYEPFGPTTSLTFGNGVKETQVYDLDYRMTGLADTGTAAVQKLGYVYDPANNIIGIADKVNSANSQAFKYDPLNRLSSATSAKGGYGSFTWTYDPVGNRLTQVSGAVTTAYGYAPGSNRLASATTGAVTQTVGTTVAGNIKSFSPALDTVTALTYNQANRLATASAGTSQVLQYTYDAFGKRIVKVGSATTLFQYDQSDDLLEQADSAGASQVDYVYLGSRPVATIQPSNGQIYFLHDDHLGTPQAATDNMQAVVWSATYQPFGYTSTDAGAIVQDLRLPGQEFEIETGWDHNGFRNYAPGLGRYLQSDPVGLAGGDLNPYRYAKGNPVQFVDPSGLDFTSCYSNCSLVPPNLRLPFQASCVASSITLIVAPNPISAGAATGCLIIDTSSVAVCSIGCAIQSHSGGAAGPSPNPSPSPSPSAPLPPIPGPPIPGPPVPGPTTPKCD